MNYSPPTKRKSRRKPQWGAILFWVFVGFLLGAVCGALIVGGLSPKASAVEKEVEILTSTVEPTLTPSPCPTPEPTPTPDPKPVKTLLGEYRITAFCSCEICCGEWANNRPNGIVYGASGNELIPGVACASSLPFGTVLEVEGVGQFIVEDRMAQWVIEKYDGEVVDIYFNDHDAACEFGLQYHNVYIVEEPKNGN